MHGIWRKSVEEIHTAYWNQTGVTLHPVVVYYKKNGETQHKSYVVVSDEMSHSPITVPSLTFRMLSILLHSSVETKMNVTAFIFEEVVYLKKVMGVLNDILLTSYSFVGHSFCCTTETIAWPFPVANFKIISTSPNTIQRVYKQYEEIKRLKENLPTNHLLVQMDFAENYSCKSVEEIQTAYWNQSGVTLHPVVVYYKKNGETFSFPSL
jgi:hypothetical protein